MVNLSVVLCESALLPEGPGEDRAGSPKGQ